MHHQPTATEKSKILAEIRMCMNNQHQIFNARCSPLELLVLNYFYYIKALSVYVILMIGQL